MEAKAIPMQDVFLAAATAGVIIGHDGASAPLDVADVMPVECRCGGTGYLEVKFAGQVIARPACRGCADG